jgi:hypothetical protein
MSTVYFSHSYKPEDASINEYFGLLLDRNDLTPMADPPSDAVNAAKLERHLRSNDGMICIVTQREGGYSKYIYYEMNLCIRSRKPLLVFVEDSLPDDLVPPRILQRRFSRKSFPRQTRQHNHAVQIFKSYLGTAPEYQPSIARRTVIIVGFSDATRAIRDMVQDTLRKREYSLIDIRKIQVNSLQDPVLSEAVASAELAVCNGDARRALAQYVMGALQSSIVPCIVATMREDYSYRHDIPSDLQPLYINPRERSAAETTLREQLDLFDQDFLALGKRELVQAYMTTLKAVSSRSGHRGGDIRDIFVKELVMGDKQHIGGDVIGSAVGSGASVTARDITVYKERIDRSPSLAEDVKAKLKEAREAVEKAGLSESDKADLLDDLGKLTGELEKPGRDASRVQRFLNRIMEVSSSVGEIISSAASISRLFAGL